MIDELLYACAITLLLATAAGAQIACSARAEMVERLTEKDGERLVGIGFQNEVAVVEVWVSIEKRTWTILHTSVQGRSCIVASGLEWLGVLPRTDPIGDDG